MDDDIRDLWHRYLSAAASIAPTFEHDGASTQSVMDATERHQAAVVERLGGLDETRSYLADPVNMAEVAALGASVRMTQVDLEWALTGLLPADPPADRGAAPGAD